MLSQSSLDKNSPVLSCSKNSKKVAILLGCFNGDKYLEEQLLSISNQTHKNWSLYASDDNSSDRTYAILQGFASKHPSRVHLIRQPSTQGVSKNFLSLVLNNKIDADFFAFADQDDYWYHDKLERSIECLLKFPETEPVVYGSRTEIVDKQKNNIGFSTLFTKKPCFKNALVQSIIGGNTMLFNRKAREIIQKASSNVNVEGHHDWWIQIVIAGCGGHIFYDPKPSLKYRQHEENITGSNLNWSARFLRIAKLFHGRFKFLNDINTKFLQESQYLLTSENRVVFNQFVRARTAALPGRCLGVWKSGVFRQTFMGNLGLFVATLLGKI